MEHRLPWSSTEDARAGALALRDVMDQAAHSSPGARGKAIWRSSWLPVATVDRVSELMPLGHERITVSSSAARRA